MVEIMECIILIVFYLFFMLNFAQMVVQEKDRNIRWLKLMLLVLVIPGVFMISVILAQLTVHLIMSIV